MKTAHVNQEQCGKVKLADRNFIFTKNSKSKKILIPVYLLRKVVLLSEGVLQKLPRDDLKNILRGIL